MPIQYEIILEADALQVKDLCNELMAYQKSKAFIYPEFFDGMSFETRMLSSLGSAKANHIVVARDGDHVIGYAYSSIAPKITYSGNFATLQCDAFFDFDSVAGEDVGCLSQFYLREEYRSAGIGSRLFSMSMEWLNSFPAIRDHFIFVSNGNDQALNFYLSKGFLVSHQILDGFITVLRNAPQHA